MAAAISSASSRPLDDSAARHPGAVRLDCAHMIREQLVELSRDELARARQTAGEELWSRLSARWSLVRRVAVGAKPLRESGNDLVTMATRLIDSLLCRAVVSIVKHRCWTGGTMIGDSR
jgi:hypothetical protein